LVYFYNPVVYVTLPFAFAYGWLTLIRNVGLVVVIVQVKAKVLVKEVTQILKM